MAAFDEAAEHAPQLSLSVGVLLAKDLHDEALRFAETARQSATDARAESVAWRAICRVKCSMAEQPRLEHIAAEAAKAAEAAVVASERAKDSLGKAAGLNVLAKAYLALKDEQQALRVAEEALTAFRVQANQAGDTVQCMLRHDGASQTQEQNTWHVSADPHIVNTVN